MNKAPALPENRPALDSAFPSLFLMGFCLLLAIACITVCAWKIILLEQEQRETEQERLLLERDRDAFLTYGAELPRLTMQHGQLARDIASLDERRKELEKSIEDMSQEQTKLRLETGGLAGTIAAMEAQADATRAELSKTAAELDKLRPDLAATRKEVDGLKARESALNESIAKKQKDESRLLANIAGLERSRAHAQEFVARLNEDKNFYAGMQKNFERTLANFEETLAKSGSLTSEYALKLEDMGKFKSTLDQGMAVLAADLQGVAGNLEAIKQDRANYAALLRQESEQQKLLREHVESIAANNKKLASALETIQNLDKKLQSSLAAEAAVLQKLAENIKASLVQSGEQGREFGQILDNGLERQREIAKLVKEAREELNLNHGQRAELETVLEKLRAMLLDMASEKAAPAPEEKIAP